MRDKQKKWSWGIAIAVVVFLVVWLIIDLTVDCAFLKVDFAHWLSIFLAFLATFIITFYFANKKQDYEKYIEAYEVIICKMQNILVEDPTHLFSPNFDYSGNGDDKLQHYNKEILLYFKKLGNKLDLLKKYVGDLTIKDELDFVENNLSSFKEEITDNLYGATLKEKKSYIKKQVALIDNKLDEIRLKLYIQK
ncbi:MAG: hypothetical protein IJQ07_03340 [Clostridia bacterium]|nr:hypothetical protein [Clostridia bacterium]